MGTKRIASPKATPRRQPAVDGPVATVGRLTDLKADPLNANAGTERGREMLEASIRSHGAGRPIFVDKHGVLIGGNKTRDAALAAGLEEAIIIKGDGSRLVVFQREDLDLATDPKAAELAIADNRVGEVSLSWDPTVLQALVAKGVDLKDLWTERELVMFLAKVNPGLTDPDAVPEERATDIVAGDIFALGRHRLVCGDSTAAGVVAALLGEVRPHLMVTDPPYGVDYDPDWRNRAKRAGSMQAYGASSTGTVVNDNRADWSAAWELFPGSVCYVWHGALHATLVAESLAAAKFDIRAQIIWAKQHAPISRGHYHWQHEPCWYAVRKGSTGHWAGDRKQTTLWQISNANAFGGREKDDATGHGTQKPVECMRRPIENKSSEGQAVYEPFLGSGTTVIAAEQTGRACYAVELKPSYVQMAIDRWEAFTGDKATKVGVVTGP
jgi:DNA modification methylase